MMSMPAVTPVSVYTADSAPQSMLWALSKMYEIDCVQGEGRSSWRPLEVPEADAGPKAVLVEAAGDVVLQLVQHIRVHGLDLGPPLPAAAQRPLLQAEEQCVARSAWEALWSEHTWDGFQPC